MSPNTTPHLTQDSPSNASQHPHQDQAQSPAQEQYQDCLSCKIVGTIALASVGLYTLNQSRSHQPGSPFARRVMAGVGVCFLGMSWIRWNNFRLGGFRFGSRSQSSAVDS